MDYTLRYIDDQMKEQIEQFCTQQWGSSLMVSCGQIHDLTELPGFVLLKVLSEKGI